MDEDAIQTAQRELVAWGILEAPEALALTRRFRGAIMRAAAGLQEEEKAGRKRPGHPMEVAIGVALEGYPLPPGALAGEAHRKLLLAIELAALPPAVRGLLES